MRVLYDPAVVSYDRLLETYWRQIDPTREDGMFLDSGFQYTSAIFVDGEEQREKAEASVRALEAARRFPGPIKARPRPRRRSNWSPYDPVGVVNAVP